MKTFVLMLRRLFDERGYGFMEGRCIPAWYETLWFWEPLRVLVALLRNVWRSLWRGKQKPIVIRAFDRFVFPLVQRPYPVIDPIALVSVQPMQRAVGLDALIKKQFGRQ